MQPLLSDPIQSEGVSCVRLAAAAMVEGRDAMFESVSR